MAPPAAAARTSTPSDGPTQRGSVPPRTLPAVASVPDSGPKWLSISSGRQPDQSPSIAWVRTEIVPLKSSLGFVQVTPIMAKRSVSRFGMVTSRPFAAGKFTVCRAVVTGPFPAVHSATSSLKPTATRLAVPATAVATIAAPIPAVRPLQRIPVSFTVESLRMISPEGTAPSMLDPLLRHAGQPRSHPTG
ncbi:hypothetical protein DLJ46_00580 [Micromonospora globispora]|uniref:Uncharacterized protein n=1 Tax=Micromonospora globispora TaxID=1450148 RepID=A0A317KJ64_9ACTN|nr:hypothetical protein DLJ46_00580 [Micromonospora globispora]